MKGSKGSWIASGALIALFTLTGPAAAQEPSARERAWRTRLEAAVGPVGPIERVERVGSPGAVAQGVRSRAGEAIVERLRFPSAAAAQEFLARTEHWSDGRPVVGELRGDQVVLVHGDVVRDAALARAALDAAWSVAPAPAVADATFAHLGGNDLAVSTRLPEGPLRESIDQALAAIQRHGGPDATSDAHSGDVRFDSGFQAHVRSDGDGAAAVTSSRPGGVDAMQGYLAALQPESAARSTPGTPAATEGAAGVLRRLFGQ